MSDILVEQKGPVTWITLNRPASLNALTYDMHHGLQKAFDDFAADSAQRICVVTGAGDKAFCAGSDLKGGLSGTYPKNGYAGLAQRFDLNKPVIAAVNGFALGGGFELALSCDLIIASDRASFGLPEPLVGAIALGSGLHRLPRQIGLKPAMGLILTSRRVSAEEGVRMGFVNEAVAPDKLHETVNGYCDDILKGSPVAIAASKAIVNRGLAATGLEAALAAQPDFPEFKYWKSSDDAREGIAAFTEKRQPEWTGR